TAAPPRFATDGLAQLGSVIVATGGTAAWTVESVPKDYTNGTSYMVGQRVFMPGDNDHVFECIAAGTSVPVASTTITAASHGQALFQPIIHVADTSAFPDTAGGTRLGIICVVTSNGRQFLSYTGKTASAFTGCNVVSEVKAPSGTMATGGAVTGPFPWVRWGVPVRCSPSFLAPGHREEFYDLATGLTAAVTLPQATLNVESTAGFASSGTLQIWTGSAYTTVTYTDTTANSFTGCSGGTGMASAQAEVGQGPLCWREIASGNIVILGQFCS